MIRLNDFSILSIRSFVRLFVSIDCLSIHLFYNYSRFAAHTNTHSRPCIVPLCPCRYHSINHAEYVCRCCSAIVVSIFYFRFICLVYQQYRDCCLCKNSSHFIDPPYNYTGLLDLLNSKWQFRFRGIIIVISRNFLWFNLLFLLLLVCFFDSTFGTITLFTLYSAVGHVNCLENYMNANFKLF